MRLPKFRVVLGLMLMVGASFIPSVFFQNLLAKSVDVQLGGVDFSAPVIQFIVILIGAMGYGMIRSSISEGIFRQNGNRKVYR